MKTLAHVIISGEVQGVWFRASTKQQAEMHNLTGWVKNTNTGDVEAVFEGEKQQVDAVIQWCHKGTPLSHVKQVQVTFLEPEGKFSSFKITHEQW